MNSSTSVWFGQKSKSNPIQVKEALIWNRCSRPTQACMSGADNIANDKILAGTKKKTPQIYHSSVRQQTCFQVCAKQQYENNEAKVYCG